MNIDKHGTRGDLSRIIFITGGTKSGKSEFAEHLAQKIENLTYIALSKNIKDDEDWQKKISMHRKRRPKYWKVIESTDLLNILNRETGPILIDSIGGFVMENINNEEKTWLQNMNLLLKLLSKRNYPTFIVGEQVGWSLVSEYKIGNRYIERIGDLQKNLSRISKDNWITINGRAIKLEDISIQIPYK